MFKTILRANYLMAVYSILVAQEVYTNKSKKWMKPNFQHFDDNYCGREEASVMKWFLFNLWKPKQEDGGGGDRVRRIGNARQYVRNIQTLKTALHWCSLMRGWCPVTHGWTRFLRNFFFQIKRKKNAIEKKFN